MMKKLAAAIVCAILCCCMIPTVCAAEADPAEISTPADLEAIADNPYGNYILTADIDMAGIDWTPLAFYGHLDGAGHTLYNLTVNRLGEDAAVTVDGNHKEYDTYFAGLFSVVRDAVIQNLALLNVDVHITTEENCFAAGLAGFAEDTAISGCSVKGRISLYQTNRMCGVAGIVGFGHGTVSGCTADMELVFVDGDTSVNCEEFLGGILACGYSDIESCTVTLKGYASVDGYVHNGGIVGMYYVYNTAEKTRPGYVRGCSVDAAIYFYEDNTDRRAYCRAEVGEVLNHYVTISGNTVVYFENGETFDYDTVLLPEQCVNPTYTETVTAPTCTEFGYTTFTCTQCGYTYTDDYVCPAHTPGEWVIETEPTYDEEGKRSLYCTVCGKLLQEEVLPRLIYVSSCQPDPAELHLAYKASACLYAEILPADAYDTGLTWTSSDESVATVDAQGNVYAAGRGTAVITCASADGNASGTCEVTVRYTFLQWLIMLILFGWIWY